MKNMNHKVTLVTGAAQGIGFATAKLFAESGATVVLADYNEKLLTESVNQLIKEGYEALAIKCNVADEADVKAMIDQTVKKFGRLDYAFNNAGIQNELAEAENQTKEDFDRVISVNLEGVWNCMKYELKQMKQQGYGAIVNCSSIGGILGGAMRGTYHASKHGIIGLTKSAAIEYAPLGIRINTICPGIIHTPMLDGMMSGGQEEVLNEMLKAVPAGRLGKPEEMANAVVWLCSDSASFIIGHTLVADGGYSIL